MCAKLAYWISNSVGFFAAKRLKFDGTLTCSGDLPVQVRDTLAGLKDEVPRSDVNKQFFIRQAEAMLERGETPTLASAGIAGLIDTDVSGGRGAAANPGRELLKSMARNDPYYKRNRQHLCSFYAKGACNRGDECPYRHELPVDNDLAKQNIKDRYYGSNDPVARKMLIKGKMPKPPEDRGITSLYLQGVEAGISESDLRDNFLVFGDIRTIAMLRKSHAAFVTFATREGAERAMEESFMNCSVKGHVLRVSWGKPKTAAGKDLSKPSPTGESDLNRAALRGVLIVVILGAISKEPTADAVADIPLPPPPGALKYASQNPNNLAARVSDDA